ncbi:fumarate hydratase [Sedimentibacter hydroxybenzoicus DSM 7310]|uniref:Fumarate hydratase n=1 Tax=Sedimentibacter hydroxybenzoicus DSM 7310 TaxID=1123245 RepID=A0A974GX15_SEDHY|nr:fumarate hydratase [Sedimentibacter hydroxybenzoicus]NYB74811.1 fumarate hydratase [Sedimentibacter hydroxybenzoicus DSM 7310]
MREIHVELISKTVERLCIESNYYLPQDVKKALQDALEKEESPLAKEIIEDIIKNQEIARTNNVPICQDTGLAVIFLELGQEVRLTGGDLNEAIDEGVRRGYKNGYLRKSAVDDPFMVRKNTGDNTPAIIHTKIVPGDKVKLILAPKGGGSENMSALAMLKPSDGVKGIKQFVLDTVDKAGSNPCPPIIVGIGVGGTIEKTTLIAKQALLRTVGEHNSNPDIAKLEEELLEEINKLGIGPQGFGGRTTALAVHIETFPAHIASMPVTINIQCHVARHQEAII